MHDAQIDALIVRHLGDLDMAASYLANELEPRVASAMNSMAEKWAKKRRWRGQYSWSVGEDDYLWLAPQSWAVPDSDNDVYLSFCLWGEERDDFTGKKGHDYFWLTRLLRAGQGKLGFLVECETQYFGGKAQWKKFVRTYVEKLRAEGFVFMEGSGGFFRPLVVDAETMAKAIEANAIEDALGPFVNALDDLKAAQPAFDELLQDALQTIGGAR
ncbi:hypothetical protein FHS78_003800 [Parvibaculum indicum]|uniref:hypothetical protein n=1 Tax=Parvibaculum indicum TaxID=562969 RepID=UPI0014203CB0|nr:hypothetical protein [Parvibaculum indicum]NIJ43485.1 hypothetical protein [Parvibaculum indicum]